MIMCARLDSRDCARGNQPALVTNGTIQAIYEDNESIRIRSARTGTVLLYLLQRNNNSSNKI